MQYRATYFLQISSSLKEKGNVHNAVQSFMFSLRSTFYDHHILVRFFLFFYIKGKFLLRRKMSFFNILKALHSYQIYCFIFDGVHIHCIIGAVTLFSSNFQRKRHHFYIISASRQYWWPWAQAKQLYFLMRLSRSLLAYACIRRDCQLLITTEGRE